MLVLRQPYSSPLPVLFPCPPQAEWLIPPPFASFFRLSDGFPPLSVLETGFTFFFSLPSSARCLRNPTPPLHPLIALTCVNLAEVFWSFTQLWDVPLYPSPLETSTIPDAHITVFPSPRVFFLFVAKGHTSSYPGTPPPAGQNFPPDPVTDLRLDTPCDLVLGGVPNSSTLTSRTIPAPNPRNVQLLCRVFALLFFLLQKNHHLFPRRTIFQFFFRTPEKRSRWVHYSKHKPPHEAFSSPSCNFFPPVKGTPPGEVMVTRCPPPSPKLPRTSPIS